jgi:hypothetical protein
MSSGNSLKAKLFTTEHKLGENVKWAWKAEPMGDGTFKITNDKEQSISVAVGMEAKDGSKVQIDRFGNLKVGDYSVIIGSEVLFGWRARKGRGNSYRFMAPDRTIYDGMKVGDEVTFENHPEVQGGALSVSDTGYPMIAGQVVPLWKKEQELRIVVFEQKVEDGYLAYFNVIKPGDKANGKNGTKGIFIPSAGEGKPARFTEKVDGDDYAYTTAVIWSAGEGKNKGYANVQMRTLEKAIREREIYTAIVDLRKAASDVGVAKEVAEALQEEVDFLQADLDESNSDYSNKSFKVESGLDFLFKSSQAPAAPAIKKSELSESMSP